jgi:ATP-dependent Clp protease ATP-binding subunit ClpC
VYAQDEARELRHNYIGTEHLLLGLLREDEGVSARVLESLGVTLEDVRARVAQIIGRGEHVDTGMIPFTPRSKKVLELASKESTALGRSHIDTEHLLLGLAREGKGVAMEILLGTGVDAKTIRDATINAS